MAQKSGRKMAGGDGAKLPERAPEVAPSPVQALRQKILSAGEPLGIDSYRVLFEGSNDALYILDMETQVFLDVNAEFEKLTGYHRQEIMSGRLTAADLVAPQSRRKYETKLNLRKQLSSETYDLRILCRSGEVRPVEISVRRLALGGRQIVIGSIRDLTEREALTRTLREKMLELALASTRTYALTEKLRTIPTLVSSLLGKEQENELFESAAALLTDRQGLSYQNATLYVVSGEFLQPVYTTRPRMPARRRLARKDRLVSILKGEASSPEEDLEVVCPMRGKESALGLLVVQLNPKEKKLMDANEQAAKAYRDVLVTLGNLIGLTLENLRLYRSLERQTLIDPLTLVYNRRYLDQRLGAEVRRATRYGRDLSLVILDVDHFKKTNDTFGHRQGDVLLQRLSAVLRASVREVDVVCRYGGDEFILLLPETAHDRALQKAERLRKKIAATEIPPASTGQGPLRTTASFGVSTLGPQVRSEEDLLRFSDEALYRAKREGRNRVAGTASKHKGPRSV